VSSSDRKAAAYGKDTTGLDAGDFESYLQQVRSAGLEASPSDGEADGDGDDSMLGDSPSQNNPAVASSVRNPILSVSKRLSLWEPEQGSDGFLSSSNSIVGNTMRGGGLGVGANHHDGGMDGISPGGSRGRTLSNSPSDVSDGLGDSHRTGNSNHSTPLRPAGFGQGGGRGSGGRVGARRAVHGHISLTSDFNTAENNNSNSHMATPTPKNVFLS